MVSFLDCIERVPSIIEQILLNRKVTFAQLLQSLASRKVNEIILIGSGTSNTSAITARPFMEKVSNLRTTQVSASEFLNDRFVRNPDAIYVFTSQTGTSHIVRECLNYCRTKGFLTVGISESSETPLSKEAEVFVDMGCGYEEYPMRTIGYCASVFTQMLLGLELGLYYGTITEEEYAAYIAQAQQIPDSNAAIGKNTLAWLDRSRRKMLRSTLIVFTGTGALYGLALEGAMKVWETPQIASVGYELEEGMHGPNYGYNSNHCVIVLNDGNDGNKALSLAKYMKQYVGNGFVVGSEVYDKEDLKVALRTKDFTCLELAAVVQIIAYRLAYDGGRDLFEPHDNSKMESCFKTHVDK